ncbi:LamG domain-containing protein [Actinacidiphila sp. DG2A-62]|uniref:LamG domain-containing protein n=1 Tax=Actinacidiphila sp. DG2A-62 TaxID=3108821 RepID=UPI002DBED82E|nr:LamG domain-containing protein [Actinacidiphila sp. DG2A-62]MEC3996357.1 LamG domain-containing protein [Actinacidiphila sp. DG2A-62]
MGGIGMSIRAVRRKHPIRTGTEALIALVLAGAALVNVAGPARADTGSDQGQSTGHVSDLPPDASAEDLALAQARASGGPVLVDALTTPYSQTVANPSGTLTQNSTVSPTRVKLNGTWVPINANLQVDADGMLSAQAPLNPLKLSGGGNAPLATLSNADGKSLSVTMPFDLPTPDITGPTAHYADVLPGVDLDVTATELGGIREVLVVKTADAAANPALSTLHLTTTGAGLTLHADALGNLEAVDASGTASFVAPAPTMWDSTSVGATESAGVKAANRAAAGSDTAAQDPSTTEGPGTAAQSAPIPVTATDDGVSLTPDAGILRGTNTQYPVYIDPSWLPWSNSSPTWTWIESAHPSSSDNYGLYGTSHSAQPGVGVCGTYPDGGSCNPSDTEVTYYQFETSGLAAHHAYIHSATLHLTQTYSADWSCTNKYSLRLYESPDAIGDDTTWNNHPTDTSLGLSDDVGGTGSAGCSGNVDFAYTVTSALWNAVGSSWPHITFSVRGDESDANGFKRLSNIATISIEYDHAPVVDNPTASPAPGVASAGTTQPCEATTNPTDRAFIGNPGIAQGLSLKAVATSPTTPPQSVRGYFDLWDDSVSGFPTVASGYSSGGGYAASGSTVSFGVPVGALSDGHAYAWNARANDGLLSSDPSETCHFRMDLTPPTVTVPTAPAQVSNLSWTFPPAGNGQTTGLYAPAHGWVPFTAADPAPHGPSSGLACMRWSFDPELADAGWQCGSSLPSSTGLYTPATHWGTNILYAQAEDNAGNYSGVVSYAFYVPWNPHGPVPRFGDTTGDGSPDIVLPGSDGNLYAHSVPGNTQATSAAVSLAAKSSDSPAADGWNGYRIAHRGSLRSGNNVDDLVVHKDGAPQLDFYYNPGNTGTDGRFDKKSELTRPSCAECTGYAPDWSTTLQVVALGDVSDAQLVSDKFGNRTGILTTETNSSGDAGLWFYPTVADGTLGKPVCLAATGWKNFDLLSPGDASGSGKPDLWVRNRSTGDISAYTFTTGTTDVGGDGFPIDPPQPTLTGIGAGTKIGNLSITAAPLVGSDGDLTGDGIADLWSVTSAGSVTVRPGKTSDGTGATAVNAFAAATTVGNTTGASDEWPLSSAAATADVDLTNTAIAVGGVTSAADHPAATAGGVAVNGTTGYLRTVNPALNTTQSYTASAWVKLNSLTTTQTVLSQGTVNHQAFYLGYNADLGSWYFMTTTSDAASTTYPTARGGEARAGSWTQLTAVYDAESDVMSLYVNGVLASTAALNRTPVYNSTAPLTIGANLTAGSTAPYNQVNGSIADVRTIPAALTADEVHNLYAGS